MCTTLGSNFLHLTQSSVAVWISTAEQGVRTNSVIPQHDTKSNQCATTYERTYEEVLDTTVLSDPMRFCVNMSCVRPVLQKAGVRTCRGP